MVAVMAWRSMVLLVACGVLRFASRFSWEEQGVVELQAHTTQPGLFKPPGAVLFLKGSRETASISSTYLLLATLHWVTKPDGLCLSLRHVISSNFREGT